MEETTINGQETTEQHDGHHYLDGLSNKALAGRMAIASEEIERLTAEVAACRARMA